MSTPRWSRSWGVCRESKIAARPWSSAWPDSLARQRFWHYRVGQDLATPPRTIDGVMALFPMPRQVGGDPPLYFALAALPLRLTAGWPPERQVLLLRLLNVLLLPCIVACAYGAARELCADDGRRDDERRTENRPRHETLRHRGSETREPRTETARLSILYPHITRSSICHPLTSRWPSPPWSPSTPCSP